MGGGVSDCQGAVYETSPPAWPMVINSHQCTEKCPVDQYKLQYVSPSFPQPYRLDMYTTITIKNHHHTVQVAQVLITAIQN